MIAKNEQHNLKQALSFARGLVEEQIVIDTGSIDETMATARGMHATVYEYPWADDFAAAKNFALSKAKGDWILFTDADEYMEREAFLRVVEFLKAVPEHADGVVMTLINLDDEGCEYSKDVQVRLFRNVETLEYEGRIHEHLVRTDGKEVVYVDASKDFIIYHTGYSKSALKRTGKTQRNIRILTKELRDNPYQPSMQVYLATALLQNEEYRKAQEILHRMITEEQERLTREELHLCFSSLLKSYRACLDEQDEEELLGAYRRAISWNPNHPDYDYYVGTWYNAMHREEATGYFKETQKKLEFYDDTLTIECAFSLYQAYFARMRAKMEENQYPEALRYAVLALKLRKYEQEVLCTLLRILQREPQTKTLLLQIKVLLSGFYDFGNEADKKFVMTCISSCGYRQLEKAL
jgi:glycosyltransferase involved in cell wall biosynthesis